MILNTHLYSVDTLSIESCPDEVNSNSQIALRKCEALIHPIVLCENIYLANLVEIILDLDRSSLDVQSGVV